MNTRNRQQKSANISDVNKQILEIKKKIQLSEGQRKALFEVREAECKANSDETLKLKKEIGQMVLVLRENKSTSAKHRVKSARLENVVGRLVEKSCTETQEMLDLHNIDKSKQLNLLRYRIQQRQSYLTNLANEYQGLIAGKNKKEGVQRLENPLKVASSELQNNIHAIKIQHREAVHVNNRYQDIKKSLQQDSARFEFNIKCAEEQFRVQSNEIERLQKIAEEASQMRATARTALVQQEKAALNAAKARDQQETEGKKLVVQGKQELEKLERRIFQSGKLPVRTEQDTGDEIPTGREPLAPPAPREKDETGEMFEKLKEATGSSSVEEVVERFRAQRDTDTKLNRLRNSSEIEKRQLEKKNELLTNELERLKYAEAKDTEQNLEEVEKLRNQIEEQTQLKITHDESIEKIEKITRSVSKSLYDLYLGIHPLSTALSNPHEILENLENELEDVIEEMEKVPTVEKEFIIVEMEEEKWLPPPYNTLVRLTPVQQEGESPISAPTPGSEDEEEVPTRGYLKRQAQLVVDARSRRKNMRIQRK